MKIHQIRRFWPVLLLICISCSHVYFENPVPQTAERVPTMPEDLPGLYAFESDDESGDVPNVFKKCIAIESINRTQLLVSWEVRLHEKDVTGLKAHLDVKKAAGEISDYIWSERFIFCTAAISADDGSSRPEQQFVTLAKEGAWYVLTQTRVPYMLLDFGAGTLSSFKTQKVAATSQVLPEADSLEIKPLRLVARTKDGAYYFNTRSDEYPGWDLMYLRQYAPGVWLLKTSDIGNKDVFETRLSEFNKITPFQKVEDSKYLINPRDGDLELLLADKDLFYNATLRKLE